MAEKTAGIGTSMKDVARLSGVSAMTVSRAMRSPASVAPATLARVRAVVEATNYVPNRVAGSLSSKRTTVVGLIVPSLSNALYAATIQGICDVLRRHDFQLMISDSGYSLEQEEKLINAYVAQRVCGIILHNTAHTARATQALKHSGIAVVETGNLCRKPIDTLVSYSNYAAGKAMAEHLVALRHRRIAFASLPICYSDRLRERRRGFLAGLRASGVRITPRLILEVQPGLESGSRALAHLVEAEPRLDAVFFTGDVLAAGALFECQRRGIRVPSQLAIAASDDNDLMRNIVPPLTTVRFPRYEIGVRAAELVLARALGGPHHPKVVDLGFEVIRRGTT